MWILIALAWLGWAQSSTWLGSRPDLCSSRLASTRLGSARLYSGLGPRLGASWLRSEPGSKLGSTRLSSGSGLCSVWAGKKCWYRQVGEITWPCHVTGVLTSQFHSNQALNPYAIFQSVGKSHLKKLRPGVFFSLWYLKRTLRSIHQIQNIQYIFWCTSHFIPFFRLDGAPQTMALHIWRT